MTQEKSKKRGGVRKQAPKNQKRPKRADYDYPYLEPEVSLKSRLEETEDVKSYAHKLNDEEKAWMNQFMKEYVNADLTGAKHHTTTEDRKLVYDKNNARNRCWYTHETINNRLNLVGSDQELEQLMYTEGELDEETGNDSETH